MKSNVLDKKEFNKNIQLILILYFTIFYMILIFIILDIYVKNKNLTEKKI